MMVGFLAYIFITGNGSGMGEKIEKSYGLLWTERKRTVFKRLF